MSTAATLGIAAGIALAAWLVLLAAFAVATRARDPRPAASRGFGRRGEYRFISKTRMIPNPERGFNNIC